MGEVKNRDSPPQIIRYIRYPIRCHVIIILYAKTWTFHRHGHIRPNLPQP